MRIRKLKTRQVGGKTYYTHRLVHSVRTGDHVEQVYLLNLGARFAVPEKDWKTLCWCILERLRGQRLLPLVPDAIQAEAEALVQRLVTRQRERLVKARLIEPDTRPAQWRSVDVANQTQHDSRTVGVEQVGLWALRQVGFVALLRRLGFSASLQRAMVGALVGRMAHPASDRETHRWLREDSALGEYLGADYAPSTVQQLYRASDALVDHRDAIEAHLYAVTQQLFGLGPAVTLLDLTNTYLEGEAKQQTRAKRGHSKEKRSDCPLITLALVLDDNGLVQRSRVYAGNVCESSTLAAMLEGLQAPADAVVVLDRGVATEANLTWLNEQDRRYVVVSRAQSRAFDADQAKSIQTRSGQEVQLHEVKDGDETRVYCRSKARVQKEIAIVKRRMERFEDQLKKLSEGLSKPRTRKQLTYIHERIGRIKQSSGGVGQHYAITVQAKGENATKIEWTLEPKANTMLTQPGVYALRTNVQGMTPEELWRTYIMLTDVEAVFRSLKSELGLRPVFHQKDKRTEGHLFITVLAYQMVQLIRHELRQKAELHHSWATLRHLLATQVRSTRVLPCQDGSTLHSRLTDTPNPAQAKILQALEIRNCPLGLRNTIVR